MGRGIDSQPGKVYSSESIPWFLKRLQIQAQIGGGRGKAAPLKSRGFLHFPRSRGRGGGGVRAYQNIKNISTPQKKMFKTTATILRGRGSSWVLGVVTINKLSRLFSDCLQWGPKKSVPVSTHLQNSGYWGRRQVAKNGLIEVFRCLVEICPPLVRTLGVYLRVMIDLEGSLS